MMVEVSGELPLEHTHSSLLDTLGTCTSCGYDLRGITANRCSECGMPLEFTVAVRARALSWPIAVFLICLGTPLGLAVFLLSVSLAVWIGTDILLPLGPLLKITLPCLLVFSVGVRTVAWFERASPRVRLLYPALLLVFTLYEASGAAVFVSNHVMIMKIS